MPNRDAVTEALIDARHDGEGLERIVPIVYDELRRLAGAHLRREGDNPSLEATALVHEPYLRLVHVDRMTVDGRAHFLALAGRLMRQILVDHARRRRALRRGGDLTIIGLDDAADRAAAPGVDLLDLDDALSELASFDSRQRDVVELKFFAGLTIGEIATTLGVSVATVEREWAIAKAWLYRRLFRELPESTRDPDTPTGPRAPAPSRRS
jgi:RNA polymerase sigma factor (TIGR02999 family)